MLQKPEDAKFEESQSGRTCARSMQRTDELRHQLTPSANLYSKLLNTYPYLCTLGTIPSTTLRKRKRKSYASDKHLKC
eukprot:1141015-Pelagomonas_calceolata.AAC.1